MILDDGYTESLEAHPQIRFRRFIASERKHFRELLEQERFSAAREFFAGHFSDPDGKRIPVELLPEEIAFAITSNPTEATDSANLKSGMKMLLTNPRLAIRPCSLCLKYWFDPDTGSIVEIGGQKLLRPDHAKPQCHFKLCPKGTPENPVSFNERNQKAFDHWMQWRAVGCPEPRDAVVRRNWMVFETMKERHDNGLREIRTRVPQSADRGRSVLHGL